MAHDDLTTIKPVQRAVRLTRIGLVAQGICRAFWPLWSVLIALIGALMFGVQDVVAPGVFWVGLAAFCAAALWFGVKGAREFEIPSDDDALAQVDAALPGRPLSTLRDTIAIGAGDPASVAVWSAHRAHMAKKALEARPLKPDLQLASRDPFALRYAALLLVGMALMFGSASRLTFWQARGPVAGVINAASWEGWIAPPSYTGLPVLYMADLAEGEIMIPQGSAVTVRLYGDLGALSVAETVSARLGEVPDPATPAHDFVVAQSGEIAIAGAGGRIWQVEIVPDIAPKIAMTGPAETTVEGVMTLPFAAEDDYGVATGRAVLTLSLENVDRRYGLATMPEPREAIEVQLPMPISGSRAKFDESLVENFSDHPWAHLPVNVALFAVDQAALEGAATPQVIDLPARRFFDPLAGAIVEQRRDLLWSRENATRVSQVLRTLSHRPEEGLFRSETDYLRLRVILRRLEAGISFGLSVDQRDEIAQALWDLAIALEDGDLDDAAERMKRAQERLSEAMKNGASNEEIAALMQQLRDATKDYMRQLSQQAQRDAEQNPNDFAQNQRNEGEMQMTQDDLQKMMDRIQELMEQGRMAEAQQALEELQELMDNMRMAQQQGGEGQPSPGQQAMEGLADTLREQQGLSDQAFRDLQEQFNPGANRGESQGNEGRNGGAGRGQSHENQGSEGQGAGEGDAQNQNQGGPQGQGDDQGQSLAQRQDALRQEVERQRDRLPGAGTEGGQSAREALDRAGRAMDQAEEALRQDKLADAIESQSEAMDALRESIRNLGDAMAQNRQQNGQGQQNQSAGQAGGGRQDPLGRDSGSSGQRNGSDAQLLNGEDVYRRAQDLLDQIRRRSGETDRPSAERDYLRRLLERF